MAFLSSTSLSSSSVKPASRPGRSWARVLAFVFAGIALIAVNPAQEKAHRFTLSLGPSYVFESNRLTGENSIAGQVAIGLDFGTKWNGALVYERRSTNDRLDNIGDKLTVDLYGIRAQRILTGEPGLQPFAEVAAGVGNLDWATAKGNSGGEPLSSSLNYWAQIGLGMRFGNFKHFRFDVTADLRLVSPKDSTRVLRGSSSELVTAFSATVKF